MKILPFLVAFLASAVVHAEEIVRVGTEIDYVGTVLDSFHLQFGNSSACGDLGLVQGMMYKPLGERKWDGLAEALKTGVDRILKAQGWSDCSPNAQMCSAGPDRVADGTGPAFVRVITAKRAGEQIDIFVAIYRHADNTIHVIYSQHRT